MKKNNVGRNSLIIAILGLIIVQTLIYVNFLKDENWQILLYGFEAATIGAFADWFAVRALFHEIPIPFIRKHTNIIVKNRPKLSEGIVDLVSNEWLSIDIINEKLQKFQISGILIDTLDNPAQVNKLIILIEKLVTHLTSKIDSGKFSLEIKKIIHTQINKIDFPIIFGGFLENSIKKGYQKNIIDTFLNISSKILKDENTKVLLLEKVEKTIKSYRKEAISKGIMIKLATKLGAIDNKIIADKILMSLHDFIEEVKDNDNHIVREKIDKKIIEFATNLKKGDQDTIEKVTKLYKKVITHNKIDSVLEKTLLIIKKSISKELNEDNNQINRLLKEQVNSFLNNLKNNKSFQEKINTEIKNLLNQLIAKHHHEIGNLVGSSLAKLEDDELVYQIKNKVGNDLQYIRLNGAIIGGLVGLLISIIRVKILLI